MEKVKIDNVPFGPFPTAIVGAEVNGKPNADLVHMTSIDVNLRYRQPIIKNR